MRVEGYKNSFPIWEYSNLGRAGPKHPIVSKFTEISLLKTSTDHFIKPLLRHTLRYNAKFSILNWVVHIKTWSGHSVVKKILCQVLL